jgi:hypothetical protein
MLPTDARQLDGDSLLKGHLEDDGAGLDGYFWSSHVANFLLTVPGPTFANFFDGSRFHTMT